MALGLAMIVPIGFTLKHFCIRKASMGGNKGGYDYFYLPVDSGIMEMTTCCVFTIIYIVQNGMLTAEQFFVGGIAGCL